MSADGNRSVTDRYDVETRRPQWSQEAVLELVAYAVERLATASVSRIPLTLQNILSRLGNQLGVDRTTVCALSPDRQGFRALVSWGAPGIPRLSVLELHASNSTLVRRALRGEVLRLEDIDPASFESAADRQLFELNEQKSMLVLPLRVSGGTVGCHLVGGVHHRFRWPRRFVRSMEALCPPLALALERLRIDEQLGQERKEHQDTQRIAGVGHWRHSFATGTSQGSPELYRMLHLDPRAELDPLAMLQRMDPVDRGALERQIRMLLCGHASPPIECQLRRATGDVRWVRCWGEISTRVDGSPEFVHGVLHDITERKSAEEAIEATSGRLVRAQEEERTRLGRELHDELGQRVAALTISVGSLEAKARAEAPALAKTLAQATEQLSELSSIVRSLSHSLHPAELRRLGLSRSLQSLCRRTSMLTEVDVDLQCCPLPEGLPEQTVLALYRVAQESLNNSIRHGDPTTITMSATVRGACLQLTIMDDGAGFEPTGLMGDGGLGLLGMQERMRLVRGALRIHSELDVGTIVEATVPIEDIAPAAAEQAS